MGSFWKPKIFCLCQIILLYIPIEFQKNLGNMTSKPSSSNLNVSTKSNGKDTEPELQDLESSLLALERLESTSPEFWPDHIPGVSQFVPLETPVDSPAVIKEITRGKYLNILRKRR